MNGNSGKDLSPRIDQNNTMATHRGCTRDGVSSLLTAGGSISPLLPHGDGRSGSQVYQCKVDVREGAAVHGFCPCLVEILGGFWPPEAEAAAKRPDSGQLLTAALRTEAARVT
jgi:hypothetical protein